jgi:hypothetical protein
MLDWILSYLYLWPKDPTKTAKAFQRSSSALGDRLRPWLYGLIAAVVVLLLISAILVLAL